MARESIVLGGGCFWCLDAIYRRLKGVVASTCGYAGGDTPNPTYWDLHKPGNTHAEVVRVEFDTEQVSLQTILEIFWTMHDPTARNQQGYDIGPEYRSIILYSDEKQKQEIDKSIKQTAKKLWDSPLTTEIRQLDTFWPAESDQQDYFNKNPEQGYCQVIINPKLAKFKKKFKHVLKD
jgi:peptide-methionine (S)-S-oxide reductase